MDQEIPESAVVNDTSGSSQENNEALGQAQVDKSIAICKSIMYKKHDQRIPEDVNAINAVLPALFTEIEDGNAKWDLQVTLTSLSTLEKDRGPDEVVSQIQQDYYKQVVEHLDSFTAAVNTPGDAEVRMRMATVVAKCLSSQDQSTKDKAMEWISDNRNVLLDTYFENRVTSYFFADVVEQVIKEDTKVDKTLFFSDLQNQLVTRENDGTRGNVMYELFHKKDSIVKEYGKNLMGKVIHDRFSIPENIVDIWIQSVAGDEQNLGFNLQSIYTLENSEPGCPKELFKRYGIANFARYPEKMLIRQFQERDNNKTAYGIVVGPYDDYKGAFKHTGLGFSKIYDQLEINGPDDKVRTHEFRVIEGGSKFQLAKVLLRMSDAYGPAEFGIICGHGDSDSIMFGKHQTGGLGSFYIWEIFDYYGETGQFDSSPQPTTLKLKNRIFVKTPVLVLYSCSTAAGEENMAEKLSRLDAIVTGPDRISHVDDFDVIRCGNRINIDTAYNGAKAKTYYMGQLIDQSQVPGIIGA